MSITVLRVFGSAGQTVEDELRRGDADRNSPFCSQQSLFLVVERSMINLTELRPYFLDFSCVDGFHAEVLYPK